MVATSKFKNKGLIMNYETGFYKKIVYNNLIFQYLDTITYHRHKKINYTESTVKGHLNYSLYAYHITICSYHVFFLTYLIPCSYP